MFLVGLTGGIGSGKSTVAEIFRQCNIPVIDADLIARQVVEPGKSAWKKLRSAFGDEYFDPINGVLDRKKLGALVFGNSELRRKLNAIVHPYIRWEMAKKIIFYFLTGYQFVVLDLPLLYESRWDRILQYTIVVTCSEEKQLQRIKARDGMREDEAKQRMKAQMSLQEKAKLATFIIENNGTLDCTKKQTEDILERLYSTNLHWFFRCVFIVGMAVFGFVTFRFIGWVMG